MPVTYDLTGCLYSIAGGRLVIDACGSAAEHMAAPATPDGETSGRRTCRRFIDDLFRLYEGQNGDLVVTIEFKPKGRC